MAEKQAKRNYCVAVVMFLFNSNTRSTCPKNLPTSCESLHFCPSGAILLADPRMAW